MAESQQRRTRAKAWAAEIDAARRRAGLALPDRLAADAEGLKRRLWEWAVAEVTPGRLMPWLAISYGLGIVVYFTADNEPAWWAAAAPNQSTRLDFGEAAARRSFCLCLLNAAKTLAVSRGRRFIEHKYNS